jgi:hypothetical protein
VLLLALLLALLPDEPQWHSAALSVLGFCDSQVAMVSELVPLAASVAVGA